MLSEEPFVQNVTIFVQSIGDGGSVDLEKAIRFEGGRLVVE